MMLKELEAQLIAIDERHSKWVLANSLGLEDMLLLDVAAELDLQPTVLVLETGRLHAETLALLAEAQNRYDRLQWDVRQPDPWKVAEFARQFGIDGFRDSVQARKACCRVRKVDGLEAGLLGSQAWVTGQRREQAATRQELHIVEQDAEDRLKYNPLAAWSLSDVRAHIESRAVPYNPLHDQHYPSIGCQPCTRAIAAGEDIRAGRWWWEQPETKECGLHPIK